MNRINKNIIRQLNKNARISISELSSIIGLSAPATKERIQKMEDKGIIQGYKLNLNYSALGYEICGFIVANIFLHKEIEFQKLTQSINSIVECYNTTGEKAFVIRFCVNKMSELDDLLEQLSIVCKTETSLILSETFNSRLPF
jgi:Lrp/AsnC family leucine-responsive transcriptional regulator